MYFLSQSAAREMVKQRKGKIINIASLSSFIGLSNISIYGTSKGGVASMTRQFAVELAKHNIQVNAISPGYFITELTAALFKDPERAKWVLGKIPLGRTGNPDDLGGGRCLSRFRGLGLHHGTSPQRRRRLAGGVRESPPRARRRFTQEEDEPYQRSGICGKRQLPNG